MRIPCIPVRMRGRFAPDSGAPIAARSMQPMGGMELTLDRLEPLPGRPVLALTIGNDARRQARVAARLAVAVAAGHPLPSVGVRHPVGGAPEVTLTAGAEPCRVSVSHSGQHAAAVAVAASVGIGVDLEPAGRVGCESARHFLDRREQDEGQRAHDLTSLWALKEAAWKALLLDDSAPFHALRLRFGRDGVLCRLEIPSQGKAYRAHAVVREAFAGIRLAVVVALSEAR